MIEKADGTSAGEQEWTFEKVLRSMEDQNRSHALGTGQLAWIVNPAFDLLLLANLGWLLLLLPGFSTDQDTVVDFWQVYFLTLPHRWLTLFLVVADADRRSQKTGLMVAIAAIVGALVIGSYWGLEFGTRAFVCLGFVDYVWNGWHFGSQHAAYCAFTHGRQVMVVFGLSAGGFERLSF